MAGQVSAVQSVLQTIPGASVVPIHPMIVIVNAEWGWHASPFEIGGVWVGWRKPMVDRVTRAGPMGHEGIAILAQALAERLRPA